MFWANLLIGAARGLVAHCIGHIYDPVLSQKNDLGKLTGCLPFPLYPQTNIFSIKVALITSCHMKIDSNQTDMSFMAQVQEMISKSDLESIMRANTVLCRDCF